MDDRSSIALSVLGVRQSSILHFLEPSRRALRNATLLAVVSTTSFSFAQTGASSRLLYARSGTAAACPAQEELERAVGERLGYLPFFPWAEQSIFAEITGSDSTLRARALLVDKAGVVQGSRELKGTVDQCDELIRSLALAISIALDPMSITRPASVTNTPAPTPTPAPSSPPAPRGPPARMLTPTVASSSTASAGSTTLARGLTGASLTEDSAPLDIYGWAGAYASGFRMPKLALGVRADFVIRRGWLSVGAEFDYSPAVSTTTSDGRGATTNLLAGSLLPCVHRGYGAICLLGTIGRLQGAGEGVTHPLELSMLYAAVGLRALAEVPLDETFAVVGYADVAKTLTRPILEVEQSEVWRPPQFSIVGGISGSARFH